MKTRLISYLFMIVTFIVSSFSFMSCSNDVENYIIIPGQNGTEYVKKDGSNFILNVGDSNYGTSTQTRAMKSSAKNAPQVVTYAGIDGSSITATAATNLLDLTVATNYSNNLWSETLVSKDATPEVMTNSSEGYVYAKADLSSPYNNQWKSDHTISNGELTISAIQDGQFFAPVPVEFWGRHDLAINDQKKTSWNESLINTDGWTIDKVKNTTQTVAVSRNIQYANSGVKIKLQLGRKKVLAWYDNIEQAIDDKGNPTAVKGTLITQDNINSFPIGNDKETIEGTEYDRYVTNVNERKEGNYYHEYLGYAIQIRQKGGQTSWHFIGTDDYDDINFEVEEIRLESAHSCTYRKDFTYTPSDSIDKYSYNFGENHVASGDSVALTVMPTKQASSNVIIKCKITKFPIYKGKNFTWYIEKTYDSDQLVEVTDNTEFFIIGRIHTTDKSLPTGSPYKDTWNKGVYCPDVITNIDMVIDNLCVKGAVVTDPDGANDSNIIWNIDYEYGSMDGQWSIGK